MSMFCTLTQSACPRVNSQGQACSHTVACLECDTCGTCQFPVRQHATASSPSQWQHLSHVLIEPFQRAIGMIQNVTNAPPWVNDESQLVRSSVQFASNHEMVSCQDLPPKKGADGIVYFYQHRYGTPEIRQQIFALKFPLMKQQVSSTAVNTLLHSTNPALDIKDNDAKTSVTSSTTAKPAQNGKSVDAKAAANAQRLREAAYLCVLEVHRVPRIPRLTMLLFDYDSHTIGMGMTSIPLHLSLSRFLDITLHSLTIRLRILFHLIRQLDLIHTQVGIQHCDLHFGNVLITHSHIPYIIDFSRAINKKDPSPPYTVNDHYTFIAIFQHLILGQHWTPQQHQQHMIQKLYEPDTRTCVQKITQLTDKGYDHFTFQQLCDIADNKQHYHCDCDAHGPEPEQQHNDVCNICNTTREQDVQLNVEPTTDSIVSSFTREFNERLNRL